jgi:hypothetical protein
MFESSCPELKVWANSDSEMQRFESVSNASNSDLERRWRRSGVAVDPAGAATTVEAVAET